MVGDEIRPARVGRRARPPLKAGNREYRLVAQNERVLACGVYRVGVVGVGLLDKRGLAALVLDVVRGPVYESDDHRIHVHRLVDDGEDYAAVSRGGVLERVSVPAAMAVTVVPDGMPGPLMVCPMRTTLPLCTTALETELPLVVVVPVT